MYAHQVIDDLIKSLKKNSGNKKIEDHIKIFIKEIYQSQKFHLGDVDSLNALDKMAGKKLFNEENVCELKTPYEKMWIDWQHSDKSKIKNGDTHVPVRGSLVVLVNNLYLNIIPFLKIDGLWCPEFIIHNIYYDKTLKLNISKPAYPEYMPDLLGPRFEQWWRITKYESCQELTVINIFMLIMSCKNIIKIKKNPSVKLNKKRKKSGKLPIFEYHTLEIKPKKEQEKSVHQGLWNNRVHLCRGHFKTYTEKNPLFGNVTGRFWWQPSIRGNKNKGIVIKDYNVGGLIRSEK